MMKPIDWRALAFEVIHELTFMEWALIFGAILALTLITYAQFCRDELDVRHVFVNPETGKVDRWAVFAAIGFFFVTWGFVKLFFDGKGDLVSLLGYGLLSMFPKVIEQVAGPIIRQRFGAAPNAAAPEGAKQ